MMDRHAVYGALGIKHKLLGGTITVHCYHEEFIDYSLLTDSLGHANTNRGMRTITYKKLKKILKKASK